MHNLATTYTVMNRHAEAITLYEATLDAEKRTLPPDHPQTFTTMKNLANSYAAMNRHAEALKLLDEVLAGRRRLLPPSDPLIAATIFNIGCIHSLMVSTADDKNKQAEVAMDWLQQAVAAGFKNVEELKTDTDLNALRNRKDFKKLVAELEAKAAEKK